MNRNNIIIKTTLIYFIGNFASRLLGFVLLPFYTIYLTSTDYGTVDILMSTVPLIAPIFTLQITESVFRFLITETNEISRNSIITNSLIIYILGFIVFIILYIPILYKYKFSYGILFIIYFFITYIGIFMQQVLRGLHRTIEYAFTGVISTFVHAILNIFLLVKIGLGGETLLYSSIVGSLVITIFICLRTKIWKCFDINLYSKYEIIKYLKFGIPLIPNQISWWIIGLLGKYILSYYHGISENGILAVASKFPNLITIVSAIFLQAWTENIINEYNSKDRDEFFNASLSKFIIFIISFAAFLLPLIKIYNMLAITGQFVNAWKYVPVLIIGCCLNSFSAFLGTIYTASMETKHAFTTTTIAAITNIFVSIILIPKFFIWGVVFANMISFIVLYFLRIKSISSIIKLRIYIYTIIPSVILLIISVLFYYFANIYFQIVAVVLFGIIVVYLNKNILLNILNFLIIVKR